LKSGPSKWEAQALSTRRQRSEATSITKWKKTKEVTEYHDIVVTSVNQALVGEGYLCDLVE
jgi:hypothetical protein